MTVEEIANLGDWKKSGDVDFCDVGKCMDDVKKYAEVVYKDTGGVEVWYFCRRHFREYLYATNELREKERQK